MNPIQYQVKARLTQNPELHCPMIIKPKFLMLLNGALGLAGESGEVVDHVKKAVFHGHQIDGGYMIEELGDILWYIALICDAMNISLDYVMDRNIDKLERRYHGNFTTDKSVNRNNETNHDYD